MAKTTKDTVETVVETVENEMNEEVKNTVNKSINEEKLDNFTEIEVISLVPNVSYKDSKTHDMYEWNEVGHIEPMTFEVIQNMWRNNKSYFKNLWLKPNDERVIKKLGLAKTFDSYEFLTDEKNYTKNNIENVCKTISDISNSSMGLKLSISDCVKAMVVDGRISDVSVIRKLEKCLNIELIDFIQ